MGKIKMLCAVLTVLVSGTSLAGNDYDQKYWWEIDTHRQQASSHTSPMSFQDNTGMLYNNMGGGNILYRNDGVQYMRMGNYAVPMQSSHYPYQNNGVLYIHTPVRTNHNIYGL